MLRLLVCNKENIIIFQKKKNFWPKYYLNIKHYKAFYRKSDLISYTNSNYISIIKSRQ